MPITNQTLVRDSQGLPVPQYFNNDLDKFEPLYGAEGGAQVSTLQRKFRSDFIGGALNPAKWELVQTGAGQTITHLAASMTIAMGTTANAETIIRSVESFSPSLRLLAAITVSQRIANNDIYIELVAVDETTGLPQTGADESRASWRFTGTTATTGHSEVATQGQSTSTARTITSPATIQTFEIEMFADETWFHQRTVDSTAARVQSYVHNRMIPDPNKKYKIQIRTRNGAVAPASSTVLTLDFVTLIDYTELTTEITASRGAQQGSMAMPVIAAGGTVGTITTVSTVTTANVQTIANFIGAPDTTTNLAASATFTGTSRDANSFSRFRVAVAHTAGNTPGHLVIQQSTDNTTFRETHRIPIPSDGLYRTFDFAPVMRYVRILFVNGATAQTFMYIASRLVAPEAEMVDPKYMPFLETTTALGISAAYTGNTLDLGPKGHYSRHHVQAFADQAGTAYLEQSRDGTTWRTVSQVAVAANTIARLTADILMRYVRVRYVNGAVAQTAFELTHTLGV